MKFGLKEFDDFEFGKRVYSKASEQEKKQSWENDFTDPKEHTPEKYTYLIHGLVSPFSRIEQQIFLINRAMTGIVLDSSQNIDLLQDPLKIKDKKIISTSVIDEKHTETWGDAGLILSTPFENIIKIGKEDLGTDFSDPKKVVKKGLKNLSTVKELMQQTPQGTYNEVVLTGTVDNKQRSTVDVKGFWVKVLDNGKFVDEKIGKQIQILAGRYSLPLIRIEKPSTSWGTGVEFLQVLPSDPPFTIAVNKGDVRYLLNNDEGNFIALDKYKIGREMTREEFDSIKSEIEEKIKSIPNRKLIEPVYEELKKKFEEYEYRKKFHYQK